jgi:formate dehydrogenase gamma subunit
MDKERFYLRFPIQYRIEHWLMAVNFILLAITGLIQMYAEAPVSIWIANIFGSPDTVRVWHHTCAVILIIQIMVHIGFVTYREFITLQPRDIIPGPEDTKNALLTFFYNIGFHPEKPKEGRYTFAEKAEYWAVVWGTLIMVISGYIMWNPVYVTRFFPGEIIPAAKVAHGMEAILAVLAILVWHFYFVLFKKFNTSMWTGYLTEEDMEEEHPLELEKYRAGELNKPIPKDIKIRYWQHYFPMFTFFCMGFLYLTYLFVTFEQTAIDTEVPAENVQIFAPLDGAGPTGALISSGDKETWPGFEVTVIPSDYTWADEIKDIFGSTCTGCHGENGSAGLNLASYTALMDSGIIKPGDVEGSYLLDKVGGGDHYAKFSEENLNKVISWIEGGAPSGDGEDGGGDESATGRTGVTWSMGISAMLQSNCGSCHGSMASGGLNVTAYENLMDAEVVTPFDAEASSLYTKIADGSHMGKLGDEDLATLRNWISEGAISGAGGEEAGEPAGRTGLTWETGISGIFATNCGTCHSSGGMGGVNFGSYATIMDAGVISPGNADGSKVIQKIAGGNHMGKLSSEDLATVKNWINAGAPGEGSGEEEIEEEAGEEEVEISGDITWDNGISAMLSKCAGCHGAGAMAGIDFRTYDSAMSSGVIVAGNSSGSRIVTKMQSGSHPVLLSDSELANLEAWIDAGASGPGGAPEPEEEEEPVEEEATEQEPDEFAGGVPDYYWEDVYALFESNCLTCHGSMKSGGLDLRSYNTIMEAGVVTPDEPDSSRIIQKLQFGDHYAQLESGDLSVLRAWILGGARHFPPGIESIEVEEPEEEPPAAEPSETESSGYTWDSDIGEIFASNCTTCHGSMAIAGVNMSSFREFMDSGVITPGDPDNSKVVMKMRAGGHAGNMTDEELQKIIEWIESGAPGS